MKTVIWLEDNLKLIDEEVDQIKQAFAEKLAIHIWDGERSSCGEDCLKDFKHKVDTHKDEIVAFILDMRITVNDLTELGLPTIQTQRGFTTGLQIAKYCLDNHENYSPWGDRFNNTPVMIFSVAGTLKGEEVVKNNPQKYTVLEKTDRASFKELEKWLKKIQEQA